MKGAELELNAPEALLVGASGWGDFFVPAAEDEGVWLALYGIGEDFYGFEGVAEFGHGEGEVALEGGVAIEAF